MYAEHLSGTAPEGGENAMTQTMTLDGLDLDQRQTIAFQEWERLSKDGMPPLQQDFRPDRIARALPAAMLLHVERDGPRIRFQQRLEGRFVVLAFGEGSGNDIEKIYTDEHLHHMMPRYLESATTGDAAMTQCTAPQRHGEPFDFNRLILPFADAQGGVNRLLVVFHFEPVALARLPGPLAVRREIMLEKQSAPVAHTGGGMLQARQAG